MARTIFHGPKVFQAIEVLLYLTPVSDNNYLILDLDF